jgi:hypothetical protein
MIFGRHLEGTPCKGYGLDLDETQYLKLEGENKGNRRANRLPELNMLRKSSYCLRCRN